MNVVHIMFINLSIKQVTITQQNMRATVGNQCTAVSTFQQHSKSKQQPVKVVVRAGVVSSTYIVYTYVRAI